MVFERGIEYVHIPPLAPLYLSREDSMLIVRLKRNSALFLRAINDKKKPTNRRLKNGNFYKFFLTQNMTAEVYR